MRGFVTRWSKDGDFGFIIGFDEEIYFAHKCEVQMPEGFRRIPPGFLVEFEPSENKRGKLALNIVPIMINQINDRYFRQAQKTQDELEKMQK